MLPLQANFSLFHLLPFHPYSNFPTSHPTSISLFCLLLTTNTNIRTHTFFIVNPYGILHPQLSFLMCNVLKLSSPRSFLFSSVLPITHNESHLFAHWHTGDHQSLLFQNVDELGHTDAVRWWVHETWQMKWVAEHTKHDKWNELMSAGKLAWTRTGGDCEAEWELHYKFPPKHNIPAIWRKWLPG